MSAALTLIKYISTHGVLKSLFCSQGWWQQWQPYTDFVLLRHFDLVHVIVPFRTKLTFQPTVTGIAIARYESSTSGKSVQPLKNGCKKSCVLTIGVRTQTNWWQACCLTFKTGQRAQNNQENIYNIVMYIASWMHVFLTFQEDYHRGVSRHISRTHKVCNTGR